MILMTIRLIDFFWLIAVCAALLAWQRDRYHYVLVTKSLEETVDTQEKKFFVMKQKRDWLYRNGQFPCLEEQTKWMLEE